MAVPNFLVIGAQKGGTTWLYRMLKQHPDVFASTPKGLYFFDEAENFARGLSFYERYFEGSEGHRAVGEFSPNYFWTGPDAPQVDDRTLPQRIHDHLPNARIIVALRDPVERAVSAYYHHIRARRVRPDQRLTEVEEHHGIVSMGCYDRHLSCWLDAYPRSQILTLLYEEDIQQQKEQTLARVFRFLEVDDSFRPSAMTHRYNRRRSHLSLRLAARRPRLSRWVDWILPRFVTHAERWHIPVDSDERARLKALYRPHNDRLSELLGRPLPW